MRKVLLLFCLLLITSSIAFSQMKFGVKGGFNISTIVYDPDPTLDISPMLSFHIGGFFEYAFEENLNFRAELLYSGEGGRLTGEAVREIVEDQGLENVDLEFRESYNFISLPLLLKYNHSSGVSLEAGPTANFLLAARTSQSLKSDDARLVLTQDFNESVNSVDLKFAIGGGYELPSGLSFNLRYSFSLSNLYTDEQTELIDQEAMLSLFQISAGLPVFAR